MILFYLSPRDAIVKLHLIQHCLGRVRTPRPSTTLSNHTYNPSQHGESTWRKNRSDSRCRVPLQAWTRFVWPSLDHHRSSYLSSNGSTSEVECSSDSDYASDTDTFDNKKNHVSEQEQRARAQQSAYDSVVYRSNLRPLPTARDVFFTRLKGDIPQLGNRIHSAARSSAPLPSATSCGLSQGPHRATGPRSALKGSRSSHTLGDDIHNTKIVFQEHVQVKLITKWIDRSLHVQRYTLEEPSNLTREALMNSVFYLERERRAGLL